MDTSKAKEIIQLNIRQRAPSMPPDVLDALKIGIEAIEFCLHFSPDQVPVFSPCFAQRFADLSQLQILISSPHYGPGAFVKYACELQSTEVLREEPK